MNKPKPAQPLGQLLHKTIGAAFARQGFASTELVTRWTDIVGHEIGAHCEPVKLQWPRSADPEAPEPATLVLRVEGPVAVEIQQLKDVICARVNQFLGWRAVADIAIRQAPLTRRAPPPSRTIDPVAAEEIAATLGAVDNDDLRAALARLGAAIKRA